MSRGMKCNNPGCIKISKVAYRNHVNPTVDPLRQLETFKTLEDGISAHAKILLTYYRRGFKTLEQMIHIYAPAVENQPDYYIKTLMRLTGWAKDEDTRLTERDRLKTLLTSQARVEQGYNPYAPQYIDPSRLEAGIDLAYQEEEGLPAFAEYLIPELQPLAVQFYDRCKQAGFNIRIDRTPDRKAPSDKFRFALFDGNDKYITDTEPYEDASLLRGALLWDINDAGLMRVPA